MDYISRVKEREREREINREREREGDRERNTRENILESNNIMERTEVDYIINKVKERERGR